MAAINSVQNTRSPQWIPEEERPYWIKAFDSALRSAQLAEDDQAWTAVTGTLISIVTIGVVLAAVTVSICLWH